MATAMAISVAVAAAVAMAAVVATATATDMATATATNMATATATGMVTATAADMATATATDIDMASAKAGTTASYNVELSKVKAKGLRLWPRPKLLSCACPFSSLLNKPLLDTCFPGNRNYRGFVT